MRDTAALGRLQDMKSALAGQNAVSTEARDSKIGRSPFPPALISFMSESRRLLNDRMKRELGVHLRYPTVLDGVPAA